MAKKTVNDLHELRGKKVLVRVDFNVPQDEAGNVTNDRRIRAALPTLRRLLDGGAAVLVMSHLGRPKGDPHKDAVFRMDKVARRLQELLGGARVTKVDEVAGPQVEKAAAALKPGEVLVLENLRFHPGEQGEDKASKAEKEGKADKAAESRRRSQELGAQLARLADVYVNDAFGTCHRKDASMVAVPAAMKGKPRVVGLLVARELEILDRLLSAPPRPFLAVLGGAKVSDKIGFIKSLLSRVDRTLIGGAMSYTFLKAQGKPTGKSKVEEDKLDVARDLLALGKGKIVLPVDHVVVQSLDAPQTAQVVEEIPEGWIAVDIGPRTVDQYTREIVGAGTVVWNGPMGKYEDEPYSKGTRAVAEALARSRAVTVVGGGETADAVEEFGLDAKMAHVSTGGGAFLEYVEGTPFAALAQIDDAGKSP
jgi:phosphoglycerate kinase